MATSPLNGRPVIQVAVVVRDIRERAEAFAGIFGVPVPEATETDTYDKTNAVHRGRPMREARAKLAFIPMGQVTIELIEPVGSPSVWQEHLDKYGEGVHHIAFRIEGMDAALGFLDARGVPCLQRGDYTGGRYAYVDTIPQLGVMLELLENLG